VWLKVYRSISLTLAIVFVIVGLVFLFAPGSVYTFFNACSRVLGMTESSEPGGDFYQILAVGYMYVVSLLAFMMYRHPENRHFLRILIHAKSASSALSFLFFILVHPYLIYLSNGVVDGALACGLLILRAKSEGRQP
jgi:multisubunit Na+/H+ antiporter MnhB subunit